MAMTWQDNLTQATSLMDFLLSGPARRVQDRTSALQPMLRQMPTTVAAALGPQLTSNDPAIQAQGQGLLAEYLRRNSPAARQGLEQGAADLANTRQAGTYAANADARAQAEADRQARMFPGQLTQQQLGIQGQRLSNQGQQIQNQRAMTPPPPPTDAQIFEQVAGYPLPKDYVAALNPTTGNLEPVPAPNTPQAQRAQLEVEAAEKVQRTVTRFLALADAVGPTGTEMIGPAAAQLKKAREDVITAWREQAALGTPTGGELARIEDILPDPTNPFRNYYAGLGAVASIGMGADYIKQTMLAPYMDMLETSNQDLKVKRKRNWWVAPTPGVGAP